MRTIAIEEHITIPALEKAIDAQGSWGAPPEYVRRITARLLDMGERWCGLSCPHHNRTC